MQGAGQIRRNKNKRRYKADHELSSEQKSKIYQNEEVINIDEKEKNRFYHDTDSIALG